MNEQKRSRLNEVTEISQGLFYTRNNCSRILQFSNLFLSLGPLKSTATLRTRNIHNGSTRVGAWIVSPVLRYVRGIYGCLHGQSTEHVLHLRRTAMSNLAGTSGPAVEAVGSGGVPSADCRLRHGNQPDRLAWRMERRRIGRRRCLGVPRQSTCVFMPLFFCV